MKILSIGNSFSQDAHRWLNELAKNMGIELETVNLYIGGCSLKTHWENVLGNNAYYSLEVNGNEGTQYVSIAQALNLEKWDIITLQQVSQESGKPETYEPYLSLLADTVRKAQPNAKLYFHQTWAYETDSDHGGFVNYNNDQVQMYRAIKQTSTVAAQSIDAEIVPTGQVIQTLRETVSEFDYKNGGMSLCRDGFHLTFDYGRYAAAATWLRTVTNNEINVVDFEGFDPEILKKINDVVNEVCVK